MGETKFEKKLEYLDARSLEEDTEFQDRLIECYNACCGMEDPIYTVKALIKFYQKVVELYLDNDLDDVERIEFLDLS